MTTSFTSSEVIRKSQEISIKTFSIMTYRSKNGLMSVLNSPEKCHARGLTIPWCSGTADFLFMVVMTARRGLETCTSAASRTKNTSGKKFRVMEFSL